MKKDATKFETEIVKMHGMNILMAWEVSITITANEYVIRVYPASMEAMPSMMYIDLYFL